MASDHLVETPRDVPETGIGTLRSGVYVCPEIFGLHGLLRRGPHANGGDTTYQLRTGLYCLVGWMSCVIHLLYSTNLIRRPKHILYVSYHEK